MRRHSKVQDEPLEAAEYNARSLAVNTVHEFDGSRLIANADSESVNSSRLKWRAPRDSTQGRIGGQLLDLLLDGIDDLHGRSMTYVAFFYEFRNLILRIGR